MSMFTRSDKPSAEPAAAPREAAPAPRPQATAQPLSAPAAAQPAPHAAPAPSAAGRHEVGVSVISKALKITGQLESTEDIRIDGEVEGDVRGLAVTVGAGAKVNGTVYGGSVELAGRVDGRIEAERVVLTSTAHMAGDVVHKDIRIESGAYIDGHCRPEFGKTGAKPVSANGKAAAESLNGAHAKA